MVVRIILSTIFYFAFVQLTCSFSVASAEDLSSSDLKILQNQIDTIKRNERAERDRVKADEHVINQLEQQIVALKQQDTTLVTRDRELQLKNTQLKGETDQQIQQVKTQLADGISADDFSSAIGRYLGTHQFTWNGAAAGSFIYDRGNNTNTYALAVQPLVVYRLNDWISFETEIDGDFAQGSGASLDIGIGMFQLFLSDYAEINAGLFDQPFGDWYEAQSPLWVNRFITAPLLYGSEAIIPPSEIGAQIRGGLQWGALGQDFDYTTWVGNGPTFDSSLPQPVVGQALEPVTNISSNTNGKSFGTRLRFYPFPVDSNLGRLELGASTYDAKWMDGLWFNSWGVDYAYLNGNLQTRGEFAETYRQMPSGQASDNRQGWYVQVGYFLQSLPLQQMPWDLQNEIHKLEPLVRYSGVNQRQIVEEEISTSPEIGFSGSPSIFSPHAREVALGLDYWIEPSIVLQTEFDMELPRTGGALVSFNDKNQPVTQPIRATANDRAILTQLAIGF